MRWHALGETVGKVELDLADEFFTRRDESHKGKSKKETQMMFLDCPAYLDDEGAARCGLPAEVRCSYTMQSTDGPLDSVMIKCPSGHWFNGPLEFLTWKNGEGQDVGRPFDRGPGSDAMEPASTYTIMAEPEPDGSVAGLGEIRYAGERS